jgi:vacuolar-type H+-ATPase subunit I/STV1
VSADGRTPGEFRVSLNDPDARSDAGKPARPEQVAGAGRLIVSEGEIHTMSKETDVFQRLEQGLDRVRQAVNEAIDASQETGEQLRTDVQSSIDTLDSQLDSLQRQTKAELDETIEGSKGLSEGVRDEANETIDELEAGLETLRTTTSEMSEDARQEATDAIDRLQAELDELRERIEQ